MQLDELVILEMVEKMGSPAKDEGEWIAKIDLVEAGSKLKLVEHEEVGKCLEECKTVARAAQDILSDHDTDIAEKLWQVCNCIAKYQKPSKVRITREDCNLRMTHEETDFGLWHVPMPVFLQRPITSTASGIQLYFI